MNNWGAPKYNNYETHDSPRWQPIYMLHPNNLQLTTAIVMPSIAKKKNIIMTPKV